MLHNRFAGDALKKLQKLYDAGITMNGQIVLCKGVNDGKELDDSIRKMSAYAPVLQSVSVVPVGLTKFREGLYPMEQFQKEDALEVLDIIHSWQKKMMDQYGIHFIHASDEWYILAGKDLPWKSPMMLSSAGKRCGNASAPWRRSERSCCRQDRR